MNRRVFTGGVFAGLGSAGHGVGAQVKPGGIPVRAFGKTGAKVTVIGQAGGRLPMTGSKEDARSLVRRAHELGITYFDNARAYWDGQSEEVYGDVLPQWRKQLFITTKSDKRTRKEAEADLAKSLRALKTDYVDLWQIHGIENKDEVKQIFGPGGAIEAFEAAKKSGKCRFIGFTGHRDPEVHLEMLKAYNKYDSIMMPLHAADPGYLSFEKMVLPVVLQRGMAVQAMKPLANAKLLSQLSVREALSYVLSLPISCAAVGCTMIGQIEDDVRVAQSFKQLGAQEMASLRKRVDRIKGPRLEDWKRNIESASTQPPHRDA